MKWKHIRTKLRMKLIPQGIVYNMPNGWRLNEEGKLMLSIQIKRWYMPVVIVKHMKKAGMPFRYQLVALYLYYTQPRKKAVNDAR